MASKAGEITEDELAFVVVQIASGQPNGIATFDDIRDLVPRLYPLTRADRIRSLTRRNEAMWEQKIRNIKSHYKSSGNYIHDGYLEHVPRVGYRITPRGRKLLDRHAVA